MAEVNGEQTSVCIDTSFRPAAQYVIRLANSRHFRQPLARLAFRLAPPGPSPARVWLLRRDDDAKGPSPRQQGGAMEFDVYSNSPPQALAVVPNCWYALMTLRPVVQRCTSSGPSTRRCERMPVYQRASGVSWE